MLGRRWRPTIIVGTAMLGLAVSVVGLAVENYHYRQVEKNMQMLVGVLSNQVDQQKDDAYIRDRQISALEHMIDVLKDQNNQIKTIIEIEIRRGVYLHNIDYAR